LAFSGYFIAYRDDKDWKVVPLEQWQSDCVEVLVDVLRNGLDLSVQIILNIEHVILVILTDEVDRQTEVTEPAWATNPVQIRVRLPREIEVDHDIHRHDIDTTREHVRRDEAASFSSLEIMENPKHNETSLMLELRKMNVGWEIDRDATHSPEAENLLLKKPIIVLMSQKLTDNYSPAGTVEMTLSSLAQTHRNNKNPNIS